MSAAWVLLVAQALPAEVGIDPRPGARIPLEAPFRDHAGNARTLGAACGSRPTLLVFVYYRCPRLCLQIFDRLAACVRELDLEPGRDFSVVAVGIDPAEGPAASAGRLRECLVRARRPGSGEGWTFLTGDAAAIERVAASAGFRSARDRSTGEIAHAAGLFILAPSGEIARYLPGVEYRPRDVRLALVEAGEGRMGSLSDRLLLVCFAYDPARGRYGPTVLGAVKLGGVLTVAGLVLFLAVLQRRASRARRA